MTNPWFNPWHLPDPVSLATPAFIVLIVIEMVVARLARRGRFEARDTAASLILGFGSVIFGALFAFVSIGFALRVSQYRLADIAWSVPALAACFVIDDLIYYWWHRTSHRVRWLWADHVQHHSSQHYNLSTALRQPWTGVLTPGLLFKTPLLIAGFPFGMIVFVHGINLVYQFWIHTETIGKFPGPIEAVMNTPSHHRVHHATNARYLDSNYAGVFIVWDRLFGTFVAEREDDRPRYGIVKNLGGFNPLVAVFHEWAGIGRDLIHARSWREAAGFLLGPPGWSPDGSRDTSETIKARWAAYQGERATAPAE